MRPAIWQRCHSTFHVALFLSAAWFACQSGVRADLVLLKDGFQLYGKVKRESNVIVDAPSGVQMVVPKAAGYFFVDDEARRISFSHRQVHEVDERKTQIADPLRVRWDMVRASNMKLPAGRYAGFSPWDDKWERMAKIDTPSRGRIQIQQHLTMLTPQFARIDARRYNWSPHYLTSELNPDEVREALLKHKDFKLQGNASDAGRMFRLFRFNLQAGWYDKAAKELDLIEAKFPDQKEKIASSRELLQKIKAAKLMDDIELAQRVGRHQWAQDRLASFPVSDADESTAARLRALQSTYEIANGKLNQARAYLSQLLFRSVNSPFHHIFDTAVASILSDLNIDTVNRLEAFLGLAASAEREQAQNRTPAHKPEQLLAVAISSWVLGNAAAEARVDSAVSLWKARELVLEYQNTHTVDRRHELATRYLDGRPAGYDELAQLIKNLPPPTPFERSPQGLAGLTISCLPLPSAAFLSILQTVPLASPAPVYHLQARLPWSAIEGAHYLVQLPPEYHPGRLYPVLFALHDTGESLEQSLARWGAAGAKHGYIVVVPRWELAAERGYTYSNEEHKAVTEVLRDLRQRFQVDSDRVFVTGLGQGANMAFDVGLAHPDLFAGILPIAGRPRFHALRYWPNAQHLPFYAVTGDLDGEGNKDLRKQFDNWIGKGYPAIYVIYKGRGSEWFEGEVPFMIDWMSRKKRATAVPDLGKPSHGGPHGEEYQSMRPHDNHFYWLEGESLKERHLNPNGINFSNKVGCASLQGRISEGNQLHIQANGFNRLNVWLGPGMIDFEKPVRINLNLNTPWMAKKIVPSLTTMLEDFYIRADRQRLFFAKVELKP